MSTDLANKPTETALDKFNSKEYKRSRKMYAAQCTFEYFVTILVGDVFLAKLLTNIGISDSLIGIISSFVTLAFLFQLLSVFVAGKIKNIKKTVIIFQTIMQVLFTSLYLIPFMPFSTSVKTVIVMVSIFCAYIFNYLVASILFKWANSYVNPANRAEYSAVKEMISLFTGIIFTLVIGWAIDKFESIGNIHGGFLFISAAMLVLTILNFISLMGIKNINQQENTHTNPPLSEIFKNTLGNRNFVNVIIMTVLWDVTRYITIGFLGTFKTNDLLLTVGTVQLINMLANLGRLGLSLPFGRFSDRHSYASGMKLAFAIAALAFGINMFTTKDTWWCIIIYTVLFNISSAGSNQNSYNITYSYVKSDYIVHAMAIKNSIGGLFGFGASLVGSRILAHIQANGNSFLGIPMYGQQLLSAISFVMMIITILFVHFVIEKQKVMHQ